MQLQIGLCLWGRLKTCGGLATRLHACKLAVGRRLPTGAQDFILPHKVVAHLSLDLCEPQ